jgi:hypothetical protein
LLTSLYPNAVKGFAVNLLGVMPSNGAAETVCAKTASKCLALECSRYSNTIHTRDLNEVVAYSCSEWSAGLHFLASIEPMVRGDRNAGKDNDIHG